MNACCKSCILELPSTNLQCLELKCSSQWCEFYEVRFFVITQSTANWCSDDHASWYILVIKPTRCTNSQIYFWNKTLHVSDSSTVHHQEFFTVHSNGLCHTGFAVSLQAGSGWNSNSILILLAKPVWHKPLLCVQWKTPDDGQRNCSKHVQFYSKNKFEN